MKNILIFSLTYEPFMAGAELAVKHITDRLEPDKYSLDMITLRLDRSLPKRERVGNINLHRIGFSKRSPSAQDLVSFPLYLNKVIYPAWACLKALRLHKTRHYSALWCIMTYMGFPAVLFKYLYPAVPMILTLQDGDTLEHIKERKRIKIFGLLFRKIFTKPDIIQTISGYLKEFAVSMGATCPVVVIPNGVEVEKFKTEGVRFESDDLRKKLRIKMNERVVITVSRLVHKNAIDNIIDAMSYLPDDVKLLILGSGPLRKNLENQAKVLKLEHRVLFVGDIEYPNIPMYLALADLFVRPSRSEGMGSAFIEAMASGVPVVATNVGGISDFLKDKETGVFCEVDNSKDLALKITTLLEDRALREYIIENAGAMVRKGYDWNEITRRMEGEVLGEVLQKNKIALKL